MLLSIFILILAGYGYMSGEVWAIVGSIILAVLLIRKTILAFDKTGTVISFCLFFMAVIVGIISIPDDDENDGQGQIAKVDPPRVSSEQPLAQTPVARPMETNERPVIKSTPTPPRPAITEKKVIPQTPVTLDIPSATTLFRPASKPAVPEEFIAKQKAIERQKPKVSSGDSFITMPCDTQSRFENSTFKGGQTFRVKICFEGDTLRIHVVETPENDVQVKLVNVQGQKSIKGLQPENFIRVNKIFFFEALALHPNNRAMKKSGVEFVVVDVTPR